MTGNEAFIRAVYRTAEGEVQDIEGWRNSFTEDGVFTNMAGESFSGERSAMRDPHGTVVPRRAPRAAPGERHGQHDHGRAPDPGDAPRPDADAGGELAPTGARINFSTADLFYLRDGKIQTLNCYITQNNMFAQPGIRPDFAAAGGGVDRHRGGTGGPGMIQAERLNL